MGYRGFKVGGRQLVQGNWRGPRLRLQGPHRNSPGLVGGIQG